MLDPHVGYEIAIFISHKIEIPRAIHEGEPSDSTLRQYIVKDPRLGQVKSVVDDLDSNVSDIWPTQ